MNHHIVLACRLSMMIVFMCVALRNNREACEAASLREYAWCRHFMGMTNLYLVAAALIGVIILGGT